MSIFECDSPIYPHSLSNDRIASWVLVKEISDVIDSSINNSPCIFIMIVPLHIFKSELL